MPHQRLLPKLNYYCTNTQVQNWTRGFSSNRQQEVVLEGHSSSASDVLSGVPQGAVLKPILFPIYISDIATNVNSTIRMFADDCLIYRTISTPNDHILLQSGLDTLVKWFDTWHMKFNVSNCSIMKTTQNRNKTSHNYPMNGQILQTATSHLYIGVELSTNMKWK